MEARERSLTFLSLEGRVRIPFFQRTYVWDKENWEDMLDDLLDLEKVSNFFGAIILKQLPAKSGEPKELEVVDGQQRLTTLSILLKALYDTLFDKDRDRLNEEVLKEIEKDIFGILFFQKDEDRYSANKRYYVRIEHSLADRKAYYAVISYRVNATIVGNEEEKDLIKLEEINDESHRILKAYKFFKEELEKLDYEKRILLLRRLLSPENKMLVVIDLDERDDEQTIFDVLNSGGVRLTSAEIIKNALYKRAIELMGKDNAVSFYRRTWERKFLKDEDTVRYWETELKTGRLKRQNIELLLHSIGVIEGFYDPDKHTMLDLSKLYKERIRKLSNVEELEKFIEGVMYYADIYRNHIRDFDGTEALSFEDWETRLLHILHYLDISTFHPFILFVLKSYENDAKKKRELLSNLEKFVVRNAVAKKIPVKAYNKLCKQFIRNPDTILEKLEELDDDSLWEGFQKVSNKVASLILFWIELYRRYKDLKVDLKELKYNYSLEHIMPVKWQDYWTFDNVPHPKMSELGEDGAKKDRDRKIHWLGNMTLLTARLSSALKNYDFERKVLGEGRKKGIKAYGELLITKQDIVEPFENGKKVWDESRIEERTKKLFQEFNEIWGI